MDKEALAGSFSELGKVLAGIAGAHHPGDGPVEGMGSQAELARLVTESERANPWFVPAFVRLSMKAWGNALQRDKIDRWLDHYRFDRHKAVPSKTNAIVMAGNLPMVGLHDLLCTLASGSNALVKLSSQDDLLIPAIVRVLEDIEPRWKGRVAFTTETLKGFDAVIATGSNNTSRYFEYYFGKYPHIIRKNRNGVAVLTGEESPATLRALADDIFLYFGLGCRNVSKIYLPEGARPDSLFGHFEDFGFMRDHNKYINNYDYQKSILMINRMEFYDNGFVIFRPAAAIPSPVSVIHYEHYQDPEALKRQLDEAADQVQCVVTEDLRFPDPVAAGRTQFPELWDYADGVDTLKFLLDM